MEIRNFIVTLHEDGSISWNEYLEARETCESVAERRGYKRAIADVCTALKTEQNRCNAAYASTKDKVWVELSVAIAELYSFFNLM